MALFALIVALVLLVVAEAYPRWRASNTSVETVPSNLVAAFGGFRRAECFATEDSVFGAVRVWS